MPVSRHRWASAPPELSSKLVLHMHITSEGRIKRPSSFALIIFVSSYGGLKFLLAQKAAPAAVFGPALEQIQSKTPIPILLPSRLPSRIRERDIKLAFGEVRKDG